MVPRLAITQEIISQKALDIMKNSHGISGLIFDRRFRHLFGVTPHVVSEVWNRMKHNLPRRSNCKHLLWALLFLKCYGSEHVHCALVGADEKTFRKWSWIFVKKISELRVVS